MILYGDTVSDLIAKLDLLLAERPEPLARNVAVTNRKPAGKGKAVVVNQGPESDWDTINTAFLRVNIYAADEGDARDLVSLVRALMTGRGPGTVVDGDPFVYGKLNAGPNPIDDETGVFHWYLVFELRSRGTNL